MSDIKQVHIAIAKAREAPGQAHAVNALARRKTYEPFRKEKDEAQCKRAAVHE